MLGVGWECCSERESVPPPAFAGGWPGGASAWRNGLCVLLLHTHGFRPLHPALPAPRSNFANNNKLKRQAMKVIASCMPADEIAGLAEIFKAIDTDGSGAPLGQVAGWWY